MQGNQNEVRKRNSSDPTVFRLGSRGSICGSASDKKELKSLRNTRTIWVSSDVEPKTIGYHCVRRQSTKISSELPVLEKIREDSVNSNEASDESKKNEKGEEGEEGQSNKQKKKSLCQEALIRSKVAEKRGKFTAQRSQSVEVSKLIREEMGVARFGQGGKHRDYLNKQEIEEMMGLNSHLLPLSCNLSTDQNENLEESIETSPFNEKKNKPLTKKRLGFACQKSFSCDVPISSNQCFEGLPVSEEKVRSSSYRRELEVESKSKVVSDGVVKWKRRQMMSSDREKSINTENQMFYAKNSQKNEFSLQEIEKKAEKKLAEGGEGIKRTSSLKKMMHLHSMKTIKNEEQTLSSHLEDNVFEFQEQLTESIPSHSTSPSLYSAKKIKKSDKKDFREKQKIQNHCLNQNSPNPSTEFDFAPHLLASNQIIRKSNNGEFKQKPKTNKKMAVAFHSNKTNNHKDLNFESGQMIQIVDDSDPTWWKGKCNKKYGFFRSNLVTMLENGEKVLQLTSSVNIYDPKMDPTGPVKLQKYQIVVQETVNKNGLALIRVNGERCRIFCPVKYLKEFYHFAN